MANQIRITPEMMRSRAGEYTNEANKLNEIIRTMDRLLSNLQSEWEGEASRAYAEKFAQLKPGFVKAYDLINEISTALKSTAQIIEETDRSIANQFRQ